MEWQLSWTRWRNRLLGHSGFHRWASRLPFTRWVARRHARSLFDLTAGFVYAQVAAAFIESGLFDALQRGPLDIAAAASTARLSPDATRTLLLAAESLGLSQPVGDRWTLGARGAMLAGTRGVPEMIAHHRLLYADLANPLAMLRREREGALARLWSYDSDADRAAVGSYSALMAASQPMVADQALAAYRFTADRRLLDIGGGAGAFLAAIAPRAPRLGLGLFDLPAVVPEAMANLESHGLADRVALHPGSFRTDPLPPGYDLMSLVRVLHDHDDDPAAELLAKICAALPPGGRLLIVEPMAGTSGAEPAGHAYFGFYLAAMRSGRPRRPDEIAAMLRNAGFSRSRLLRTPLPLVARVMLAQR
ncbi:MAG: methyltransferase [Sphingomonadaceae bacterium]|nr:methyltransferase [Sphingomonadaceae bacterium]